MSQPTAYSKTTNFAQDEANNVGGRSSVRASRVDAELSNIETTLDQTLANLALIQRDDGKIRDGAVELFSLSSAARAALKGELTPRGDWASPISYAANDLVHVSGVDYLCVVAHTSGTFATDLAAGKWVLTASGSASLAAASALDAAAQAGLAAGQVTLATGQVAMATTQAAAAAASKLAAQAAQVAAEAARDAINTSGKVFTAAEGTAAGIAATTSGQQFAVVDASLNFWIVYRNNAGVASEVVRNYTKNYLDVYLLQQQYEKETGLAFAVVDDGGARTWIEAGLDGSPSSYSAGKIGPTLNAGNMPALADAGQQALSDENKLALVFVDSSGLRTELEVGLDGKFTQRVVDSLSARMLGGLQGVSGPAITCVGDSLTAGAGAAISYPAALASLTGRTVWNFGVGGEDSATIAGRTGSRPWMATISGGSIPTSGGVTVTLVADDGSAVAPLQQGASGINPCTIAGVTGTLSYAAGTYTFTRTAAGSAVPVNFPAPVITDIWTNHRSDIFIMWWGQNDGVTDATTIIGRQRATIEGLKAISQRWLVIGLSTSSAAFRASMEQQFYREYGRRFVNIREYLSSAAAMADAGLTPTGADLTDMGNGAVPGSLRSDSIHLNDAGYARVAAYIQKRLLELGFI